MFLGNLNKQTPSSILYIKYINIRYQYSQRILPAKCWRNLVKQSPKILQGFFSLKNIQQHSARRMRFGVHLSAKRRTSRRAAQGLRNTSCTLIRPLIKLANFYKIKTKNILKIRKIKI